MEELAMLPPDRYIDHQDDHILKKLNRRIIQAILKSGVLVLMADSDGIAKESLSATHWKENTSALNKLILACIRCGSINDF